MEFVRHPPACEFLGQLYRLREGGKLVGVAVEEAEGRQALKMVPHAVLVA
jgi:hypothetical protein